MLAYHSSPSRNTYRLIQKVGLPNAWIPDKKHFQMIIMKEPFLLAVPSYADGEGNHAVPGPIIRFLNVHANRSLLRGVIGCGNRNFGKLFCLGARMVAAKCDVPLVHQIELSGTDEDVNKIKELVRTLCKS